MIAEAKLNPLHILHFSGTRFSFFNFQVDMEAEDAHSYLCQNRINN